MLLLIVWHLAIWWRSTQACISCSGECPTQMWFQPSEIHSIFWGFRSSGRWRLGLLGSWISRIYVLLKPRESATDTHVRMSESSATPCENFRVSRPIFSLKVGYYSAVPKILHLTHRQRTICHCGTVEEKDRTFLWQVFWDLQTNKQKRCIKTVNEKNSELFLRFWPQRGRGNRLCSFMFAEGTTRAMNTWHSHFIVMRRS